MRIQNRNGFTLIELLVVIAVIGLLASVVMVSLNSARDKAKIAKSQLEQNQFIKTALAAQGEGGRLRDITGSSCSYCSCKSRDIRNVSVADPCYTSWLTALNRIQSASGFVGLDKMTRDPWGSPYGLDENEREFGPADCRPDTIQSAGQDGMLITADDIYYEIPFSRPCP